VCSNSICCFDENDDCKYHEYDDDDDDDDDCKYNEYVDVR